MTLDEFVRGVLPWVAVAISITGWVVTYRLNITAHKKQFLNTLLNDARKDIVKSIRKEQLGLADLGTELYTLELHLGRTETGGFDWSAAAAIVAEARHGTTSDLSLVLEEYEQLFPYVTTCRGELIQLRMAVWVKTGELVQSLRDKAGRDKATQAARALQNQREELTYLLDDLRVVVQNETFGLITGTRAPLRQVKGARARLGWDAKTDKLRVIRPAEENQR